MTGFFVNLLLGSFITLAMYHLMIFSGRSHDKSNLVYAFYCVGLAGLLVMGKIIDGAIKNILLEQALHCLFTYITAVAMCYFGYFVLEMFKRWTGKVVNIIMIILTSVYVIGNIVAISFKTTIGFSVFYMVVSVLGAIYLIFMTFDFFKQQLYSDFNKLLVILGYAIVIFVSVITGVLRALSFDQTFWFYWSTILFNALIFAYALARVFNREHKELIILKNDLEIKVHERTKDLEEANKKIADENQKRTNFFVNLAHEMKTPLTLILNMIKDFYDRHANLQSEIKPIKEHIKKLTNVMVDYLDFEKLKEGKEYYDHTKVFNLSQFLISKVNLTFKDAGRVKEIMVMPHVADEVYIRFDYLAMDRILNNIVENALKYTDRGGKIFIILERTGKMISLSISDTGRGIPADKLDTIFEPYYQIVREKQNYQGIGIGLNIVKQILDSVGAKITVESEPDKGTTFNILFDNPGEFTNDEVIKDITKSDFTYYESNISIRENPHNELLSTILIVEDNRELLSFLFTHLSGQYNVYVTISGTEALTRLECIPEPNLILSDILMDNMNGLVLRDKLNTHESWNAIPFLYLTALGDPENTVTGLDKGAIDYISKPFDIEQLKAKVASIINQQKNKENKTIKGRTLHESQGLDQLYKEKNLKERQIKIIELISEGLQNKEIAPIVFLSESSIKKCISEIYQIMGVQNRAELMNLLMRHL